MEKEGVELENSSSITTVWFGVFFAPAVHLPPAFFFLVVFVLLGGVMH